MFTVSRALVKYRREPRPGRATVTVMAPENKGRECRVGRRSDAGGLMPGGLMVVLNRQSGRGCVLVTLM